MKSPATLLTTFLLLATGFLPAADTPKQPIYLYLYARVTDHINTDISEDQVTRILATVAKLSKAYPQANVTATVFFSGAVSQALEARNGETHLVDQLKEAIHSGAIQPAYDGSDEPTYDSRPAVDFLHAETPQDRWLARKAAAEKFLTEGRDPISGAADPAQAGGLKKMQEVFGEAACVRGLVLPMKTGPGTPSLVETGLSPDPKLKPPPSTTAEIGGDTEAITVLRKYNSKAILIGITDANLAHLPGYRSGLEGFSGLMSPIPETAPEVYWQDSALRVSETSSSVVRPLHAHDGQDAVEKALAKVDRSHIHVIHMEIASDQNYLTAVFLKSPDYPALKYAYTHSSKPKLPSESLRSRAEVDQAFANEDASLVWIAEKFIPANGGSKFISSSGLAREIEPSYGYHLSMAGLQKGVDEYLKAWGNDTFAPPLFRADGHFLSPAEAFQVMADSLAAMDKTGKLPASVKVDKVYGPIRVLTGHGPNEGEVSVASLSKICSEIAPALHDDSPSDLPKNSIPIGLKVEGRLLNPSQFLRLMARALADPSPDVKIPIRMSYELTGPGELLPKSRALSDDGYAWTLKPAQFQTPETRSASH